MRPASHVALSPREVDETLCPPLFTPRGSQLRAALTRWLRRGGLNDLRGSRFDAALFGDPARLPLSKVRAEFVATLADLAGGPSLQLRERIERACSMHELWHLRVDVFRLVALHHDQAEADDRLAWLNRYFPTRSPRSGFGSLGPKDFK
jgi:hypothetical protein